MIQVRSARKGKWLAVAAAVMLLAGACSAKQENVGAQSSASSNNCADSAAKASFDKTWNEAFSGLGLKPPVPRPDVEVCDVDTTKWKKDAPAGGYRIGFAAQGPTNSWAVTQEEAFKLHAQDVGVKELYASADGDATKQVNNLQQLLAQQPDALVVVPMGAAIVGQLQQAAKANIPVVLCSGVLPEASPVSTVTRSYNLLGTVYADWIAKQIGNKGKIAMLSGIAGVPTAELEKSAGLKALESYPGIDIVSKQYTDWSPTKAKTIAANLLAQHPDLKAIWSDSANSNIGVVGAYTPAGKEVPPITGDSSNAFLKAMQGKNVKFLSGSFPPEMSTTCLDVALKALKGETVPSFVNVDAVIYTNKDASKYIKPKCSDDLWVPSTLPEKVLSQLKLC